MTLCSFFTWAAASASPTLACWPTA
jgi:hypothetical protein